MKLVAPNGPLTGEIELPISKSIANRYQIIAAIATSIRGQNRSASSPPLKGGVSRLKSGRGGFLPEDVRVLYDSLNSESAEINIGMAGTAMRFLTAFYSIQEGKTVTLTGDERMKQRPISELVDALRSLGADIEYMENEGFPPLRISGKRLKGGKVGISASVSSQFVSALMMIGPIMENGIEIKLQGKILSKPYIELTRWCMQNCGAHVLVNENIISIPHANYKISELNLESDWSAASYFYAMAAAKPGSKLLLKGLRLGSAQGDSILAEWFIEFGVFSIQTKNGVEITSFGLADMDVPFELDFTHHPDLAQTFAFLAVTLGKELKLTGLDNLRLKETDRVDALKIELEKLGVSVLVDGNSMTVSDSISAESVNIRTYNDHRMAMSAAVGAYGNTPLLEIEKPEVVEKSFPTFWAQLQNLGFKID